MNGLLGNLDEVNTGKNLTHKKMEIKWKQRLCSGLHEYRSPKMRGPFKRKSLESVIF